MLQRIRGLLFFALIAWLGAARADGFDFYVLSLSWSPQYCGQHPNDTQQCTKHYGFVLHGLWPQYANGGWPQNCATTEPDVRSDIAQRMLPVMPSPTLIEHEWDKHGTCSGLSQQDYFGRALNAFQSVKLPADLQMPKNALRLSAGDLTRQFVSANPRSRPDAFVVAASGKYLSEVRVCLDKQFAYMACGASARGSAPADRVLTVRPVR